MRANKTLGLAVLLAAIVSVSLAGAADDENKTPIQNVMQTAHRGPDALLKKVAKNKASAAEKQKLVELYEILAAETPPKGDKAEWDERTAALLTAAKAAAADTSGAVQQLKRASNCAACHEAHKP